jgi:hypothetical protein
MSQQVTPLKIPSKNRKVVKFTTTRDYWGQTLPPNIDGFVGTKEVGPQFLSVSRHALKLS